MRPLEYGPIGSKLERADRALEKSGPRILNIKVGFRGGFWKYTVLAIELWCSIRS